MGGVRHRRFEHPDEREHRSCEERTAEGDRAVAGVAAARLESALQSGPEEDEQERDQGCDEETDDLVPTVVVLPVGKGLGGSGLAARVASVQDEADEEQQPCQYAGERQEAVESGGVIPADRCDDHEGGEPEDGNRAEDDRNGRLSSRAVTTRCHAENDRGEPDERSEYPEDPPTVNPPPRTAPAI